MPLYMTGAIESYYYPKKRDEIFQRTLFVAPKTIALVSSSVGNMGDSVPSTLTFDKKAIEGFDREYNNYLDLCKPLIQTFNTKNKREYYKNLQEYEEKEAPVILQSGGLSVLTMSDDLMENLIIRNNKYKTNDLIDYYKARILNFKNNMKNNRFIEIIRIPNIDKIRDGKVKVRFSLMFHEEDIYYTLDEFKQHLENIIVLLENQDNYHVYLDKEAEQDYTFYAKEDVGIIISKPSTPSVIIEINESNITAAFLDYLNHEMDINDIEAKNKDETIAKLKRILCDLDVPMRK